MMKRKMMKMINTMLETIIDGIKNDPAFSECNVHFDYPSNTRPNPIKKVHICVGTEKISIAPCSTDGKPANNSNTFKLYGKITVSIKIVVPHYLGGKTCDDVISDLITHFYSNNFTGTPEKAESFKIQSDVYSDCFIKELKLFFNCLI